MKLFLVLILLIPWSASAAEVTITAPATPIQPWAVAVLPVNGLDDAQLAAVVSDCTPTPTLCLLLKTTTGQPIILFQSATPGKYRLSISLNAWRADLDRAVAATSAAKVEAELLAKLNAASADIAAAYPLINSASILEVAGTVPPPKPVTEAPWESPGLSVLILRESQSTGSLPPSQRAIFTSTSVHQWLTANTFKLPDGPAYRILDNDFSDVANMPSVLQAAFYVVKPQVVNDKPMLGVSNGKTGYVGQLPESIDALLKLLEQYK